MCLGSPEEEGEVGMLGEVGLLGEVELLGEVGDWEEPDGGLVGRPMAEIGAVIL